MSIELYHRFTQVHLPGQSDITDNGQFSNSINEKIEREIFKIVTTLFFIR